MDFATALERVQDRLASEGYPCALIGGLGLAAFGISRATLDLDLLVPADAQESAIALMEELGYETVYRSTGYSNHVHSNVALGRVDFVYVRGETRRKIFGGAREVEGPGGIGVLVPRPEHVAAMKVLAMKNDPERYHQDMADIRLLLRLPGIDRSEIREAFERHEMLGSWHEFERHPGAD